MHTPSKRRSQQLTRWPTSCPQLTATLKDLFIKAIDGPFTFEQLRTLSSLRDLVKRLRRCHEPFLIFSLLWCKLEFASKAAEDETSVDCARGYACEIAAMRLLRKYTNQQILTALTDDYKALAEPLLNNENAFGTIHASEEEPTITTPLLARDSADPGNDSLRLEARRLLDLENCRKGKIGADSFTALEVAIIAEAKHFTGAHIVQDILTEIWHGDIIFWSEISEHETKHARFYNKDVDAKFWNFARLRVPQYAFVIESFNFLILAALYLLVVVDREYRNLGWIEAILALWFLGFTYQEYDQIREAGNITFYLANPFNIFDIGIILVAFVWIVLRSIGIAEQNPYMVGRSYDVLSLQGVLLAPRLFSFLSLSPYFGTLFPCLKRLAIDFLKFLVLIVAVFAGFLVTFSVLGRNTFTISQISWLLIRCFFGGTNLGFDAMYTLHPVFGPPLMIIFVTFSQILLTTALISILSNTFSKVMDNARTEYHYLFATYCLEASKSDHMVILSPPFNLLGLLLVRPLRLILPSNHILLRSTKIWILKITHAPYVLLFSLYERSPFAPRSSDARIRRIENDQGATNFRKPYSSLSRSHTGLPSTALLEVNRPESEESRQVDVLDTDDEEGLDTGIMLQDGIGMDEETKARLMSMEVQIADLKSMLQQLLAERTHTKSGTS